MAVREILRMGHPRLREVARPVTEFNTGELHDLVADMFDTMVSADGAGLAAPQIGVGLRVVIFEVQTNLRYPDAQPVPRTILINPVIEVLDSTPEEGWEGCLSVPGMRGLVPRPRAVRYRGFDPSGAPIDRLASGFHARVLLHECDHLDGVLYPQRVLDLTQFGFEPEILATIMQSPAEVQALAD